jgi:lipopolysaccharide export system permease protein
VLRFSNISGRTSKASGLIVLVVPAVHVAILIGAETVVRQDPRLVYAVILATIAEFATGILLIWRQNANFRAIDKVPQDACLPA